MRAASRAGALPAELSTFVGRDSELAQLVKLQPGTRLLTLVGPGGVGKTRLALRLAAALRHMYADGTPCVELADLSDPQMLEQAVASALGVREQRSQPTIQALVRTLTNKQLLLILDNCEHLLDACSNLAGALLRACPQLQILATSRQALNTDGDTIWRVPPLSLPSSTVDDMLGVRPSEAVQLFVARARERVSDFDLTTRNWRAVVAICRQLDGLPLALELAAARIGSIDESDIAARLGLGLALQVRARRSAPRRQQTLRATIEWSHDLLSHTERILFRRLAVFADGWTLDAAEAICADPSLSCDKVVRGLDRLADRSLVMLDRSGERSEHGGRYRLLQIVRAYALDRLQAAGEANALRARHLAFMLALAERDAPEALNVAHANLLYGERENVRAALATAVATRAADSGLRLATASFSWWYFHGHYAEGREWLERLFQLPNIPDGRARARAEAWLGLLLYTQGEYARAHTWIRSALTRQQALDDGQGAALSVAMLGHLSLMQGDLPRAKPLCREGAARLQALGNPAAVSSALQSMVIAIELGEVEQAREWMAEWDARGNSVQNSIAAWLLLVKGRLAEAQDDSAVAEGLFHEALRLHRALPEQQGIVVVLIELGHAQAQRRYSADSSSTFSEAVELAYANGERILLARALEGFARSFATTQPANAVRLAAVADGLRSALGATAWPSDRRRLATWLTDARRSLKRNVFRAAWDAGRVSSVDQAVTLARSMLTADRPAPAPRTDPLTRRERDVVALLGHAMSNQQIAAALTISPATARTHVDHVLAKLGLHSRGQVALWARQHALLSSRTGHGHPG